MRLGWTVVYVLLAANAAAQDVDEQVLTLWDGASSQDVHVPLVALGDSSGEGSPAIANAPAGSQPWLRNGRSPTALPAGEWKTEWSVSREEAFGPTRLLRAAERIVCEATIWQLFDPSGRAVAKGRSQGSIALSADELLGLDDQGLLSSWLPHDGARRWSLFLDPPGTRCDLVWRHGERRLVAGDQPSGEPRVRESTGLIFAASVGAKPQLDRRRRIRSPHGTTLRLGPGPLLAAAWEDALVVALPQRVYVLGADLTVRLGLRAAFTPRALALDEAGRMYLIARTDAGLQLWVLSPQGKRLVRTALPGGEGQRHLLVGYEHRIVVLGDERLACFDDAGRALWTLPAPGLAGGTITASGHVITSEGAELAAYDPAGERRTLARFPGEILLTAPLLAADGALYVASRERLHGLSAR